MCRQTLLITLAGIGLLSGLATAGYVTRDFWLQRSPSPAASEQGREKEVSPPAMQQVKLTPQAQSNLGLVVKPLQATTFWRTIQVPGMVVDRPAHSDRGVVTPVTGVVTKVHHFPGDLVRPGDRLFTLRLLSESLQLMQSELFKNIQETHITQEQKKRLVAAASSGAIAETRIVEFDNQLRRLAVAAKAYRQELQTRGLTREQIDEVAQGRFVSEIVITTPQPGNSQSISEAGPPPSAERALAPIYFFEVQELKVELGQQVQAGQTLSLLSNHQSLYLEGRAFWQETPLIEASIKEGWPVQVEFKEEGSRWPALEQTFSIRHLANTIDPATRTFAFFLPLSNQSRTFEKDGRTLMLWRFRPGQKVRLHIRAEKFDNVFVLPAAAVVREGPEAYLFRQNGDFFQRKPVRVVHLDRQHVVIANDGSIPPGLFVAHNGATQLNRVLQAQGQRPAGFHVHADGSVHANH